MKPIYADMDLRTYTRITLHSTTAERGNALKAWLDGQSYLNLNVLVCPMGGQWEIMVESFQTSDKEELRDMVMFALTCKAMDALTD